MKIMKGLDSSLNRSYYMSNELIKIYDIKCELEGPYECPLCGFHMMLDATYLDQVKAEIHCPCCKEKLKVVEEE